MACHLDHSKLTGLRFCTACGQSLTAGGQMPSIPPQPTNFEPVAKSNQSLNSQPIFSPELPKNNNKLIYSIAGGTSVLVAALGLIAVTKSPAPVDIEVSLTLLDQECYDISWGYFDIPGADVELEVDGIPTGFASFPSYGNPTILGCKFSATFFAIPSDGGVYTYQLASGRRGSITKTRDEFEAENWALDLSIG